MKVAPTVIVLVRDADGFGPALADAFCPNVGSNLTRERSSFELSLDKYGVNDSKASGDLVQFLDPSGTPQVSIFLLQNYRPPVVACAVNELLASLSTQSTIVLPFMMKTFKVNRKEMNKLSVKQEVTHYAAEVGGSSKLTKAMMSGANPAPSSLQINCEALACLILMARVLNLPTVLLTASGGLNRGVSNPEFEALCELGQVVGRHLDLCFCKEKILQKPFEKSTSHGESWRALYG